MPLIVQLNGFVPKLEVYQTDNSVIQDQNAPIHLKNLINHLKVVVKDKEHDWQVSFAELNQIQLLCTTFNNETLTKLVMEDIFSLCEGVMAQRKVLIHSMLDFVYECKMVRDPARLNIAFYHPDILKTLAIILKSEEVIPFIRQSEFSALFAAIKKSNIFAESDLGSWSRPKIATLEKLFEGMLISEKTVEPTRFPGGDHHIPALIMDRLRRRGIYFSSLSAPTSPTQPQPVLTRNASSLPNTPKRVMDPLAVTESVPPLLLSGLSSSQTLIRTRETPPPSAPPLHPAPQEGGEKPFAPALK